MEYLYIALVATIFIFITGRDFCLYKRGEYNPYPFRKGKKDLPFYVIVAINIFICIGGNIFLKDNRQILILLGIFLVYTIFLIFYVNVLNFLSYRRTKDKKIAIQTVIFDIMIIVVSTAISIGIFRYTIR